MAVREVNNTDPGFWLADLVVMINNIMNEDWVSCVVVHVPNTSNAATTALAEHYLNGDGGLVDLHVVPAFLQPILAADGM